MTLRNLLALGLFATALAAGCGTQSAPTKTAAKAPQKGGKHDHGTAPHDGTIIELGTHHGEFCVDHAKKTATVYIYDEEMKNLVPIKAEKLLLSIKTPSFQVEMKADPQTSDPKGTTSRFVASHENFAKESQLEGTVSVEIDGKPYVGDFLEEKHDDHMGEKKALADPKEAEIYLKPGGLYTEADIKANGTTTVSAKYKGLKVSHDIKPRAGDKLCPVTLTKANANLTWVVGGKTYEFCCPPCVEEFVALAKEKPGEIKDPGAYVKK